MLTKEASNAVLKTLEEPPDHVVFVLCTTEMQAMLPTIRSRCQRFSFQRPGLPEIAEVLNRIAAAESIEIDEAATLLIARAATGSFRDAVTTLDQLSTASSTRIEAADVRALLGTADERSLFETIDLVAAGDAAGALVHVDTLTEGGTDLASFTTGLLGHLRALFLTQQLGAPPSDMGLADEERERLAAQAESIPARAVVRLIDLLREVIDEVREGGDPRLPLELALVKVCRPQNELALESLDQRLEQLEQGAPAPVPAARTAPAPSHERAEQPTAEPEPEPLPAEAAVSATAEPAPQAPSLERLTERWQEAILPEIQRRSPPMHSLILPARPVSWDEHEVVIGLPASTSFAIKMVDTPQNTGIVTELVAQALGATPRVRFVVLGEEAGDAAPAEQPPVEQVSEHELMSRLAEEFDAHEVQ
jgi:DNA polymerase-3 subunit gamma/tau